MKKYLLIIFLLLTSYNSYSQINRTIWGVTLKNSSKQQVRTMLNSKGYSIQVEPDGALATELNNVSFGGATWSYVSFLFVNDCLAQVCFINDTRRSPVLLDDTYSKLKNSLDKKYKAYSWESRLENDVNSVNSFIYYCDDKTAVSLSVNYAQNYGRYIALIYEDCYLIEKQKQIGESEL